MKGLRRKKNEQPLGTGSVWWCGRCTGKFSAKTIISMFNTTKIHWPNNNNKIEQALYLLGHCFYSKKSICVHSWISSSFWYSWYPLEICFCFPVFFTLHWLFPVWKRDVTSKRRCRKGDLIQERPWEAPLESLPCKPLLRCSCSMSPVWFLHSHLCPSLSGPPLSQSVLEGRLPQSLVSDGSTTNTILKRMETGVQS